MSVEGESSRQEQQWQYCLALCPAEERTQKLKLIALPRCTLLVRSLLPPGSRSGRAAPPGCTHAAPAAAGRLVSWAVDGNALPLGRATADPRRPALVSLPVHPSSGAGLAPGWHASHLRGAAQQLVACASSGEELEGHLGLALEKPSWPSRSARTPWVAPLHVLC